MKISIQNTIVDKNTQKILNQLNKSFDVEQGIKVEELKALVLETYSDVKHWEIDTTSIKYKGEYLQDIDVINSGNGLKFEIIVHDKNSKDENFSSKHLGRKFSKDDRDKNYLIQNLLTATPKAATSVYWNDNEWWGNQGNTPQCVGYAWAHWIEDGPITHGGVAPIVNPTTIYKEAQKVDEWIGENYNGTSVRGAAKYLKSQNKISAYYWAFDLNTLINAVLTLGPVVVGTNWYYNMFYPDKNGLIKVSGYLAGGHAYVINGVDTVKKQFRIKNSWGKTWGQQGHAYISFNDMSRLIREQGEICLATEVNF